MHVDDIEEAREIANGGGENIKGDMNFPPWSHRSSTHFPRPTLTRTAFGFMAPMAEAETMPWVAGV